MVRDCPVCGLANPPEAQRCDCGYDFVQRKMLDSYLTAKDWHRIEADQRADRIHAALTPNPLPLFAGANFLGGILIAVAVGVAFGVGPEVGVHGGAGKIILSGVTLAALDLLIWAFVTRGSWPGSGGKFLWLPVWVLGFVWVVVGLARLA